MNVLGLTVVEVVILCRFGYFVDGLVILFGPVVVSLVVLGRNVRISFNMKIIFKKNCI